jgi:hypothetical protein
MVSLAVVSFPSEVYVLYVVEILFSPQYPSLDWKTVKMLRKYIL